MAIAKEKAWDTSMTSYAAELKAIVARYESADILELGAGRWPSFRIDQMPDCVSSYTVNDISADELALLPEGYNKAQFDVSGDASNFRDNYDVVFSRFLAEHVPDGVAMHRNVYSVLRKGGTAFHLIPTLPSVPFLVNKYLPEWLGSAILKLVSPRREISPKFPAPYSACHSDPDRMIAMLRDIGYSDVQFRNFYGHFYYEKIPVVNKIHENFSEFVADRNMHRFGSYAYITAVK